MTMNNRFDYASNELERDIRTALEGNDKNTIDIHELHDRLGMQAEKLDKHEEMFVAVLAKFQATPAPVSMNRVLALEEKVKLLEKQLEKAEWDASGAAHAADARLDHEVALADENFKLKAENADLRLRLEKAEWDASGAAHTADTRLDHEVALADENRNLKAKIATQDAKIEILTKGVTSLAERSDSCEKDNAEAVDRLRESIAKIEAKITDVKKSVAAMPAPGIAKRAINDVRGIRVQVRDLAFGIDELRVLMRSPSAMKDDKHDDDKDDDDDGDTGAGCPARLPRKPGPCVDAMKLEIEPADHPEDLWLDVGTPALG